MMTGTSGKSQDLVSTKPESAAAYCESLYNYIQGLKDQILKEAGADYCIKVIKLIKKIILILLPV